MKRIAFLALLAFASLSAHAKLPFIDDDFAKATALAKSKKVPIFIETWAPW